PLEKRRARGVRCVGDPTNRKKKGTSGTGARLFRNRLPRGPPLAKCAQAGRDVTQRTATAASPHNAVRVAHSFCRTRKSCVLSPIYRQPRCWLCQWPEVREEVAR